MMGFNFKTFQNLMSHRVHKILVISSPYDAFIMEEDGGMLEHVFSSYRGISLTTPPRFTVVATAGQALEALKKEKFNLVIIVVPKFLGMEPVQLGHEIKQIDSSLPVVLLAHGMRSLYLFPKSQALPKDSIDNLFVWLGNRDIMWTIIKWVEDRMNVDVDTQFAKVQVLILIEDSPAYYSSLLPILYRSIVSQTQTIIDDTLNEEHRLWKLRARTKILLAKNYEEGVELYKKYKPYLLGVFSDTRYSKDGKVDPKAGIFFLKQIKREMDNIPLLLLSSEGSNADEARKIGAHFINKNSPSLHQDIRQFMLYYMGFGDFIFRMPNGEEVARANNLNSLEKILEILPEESLKYHVALNHFSNWLMARSEIELASRFRAAKHNDFENVDKIREFLINGLHEKRITEQRGVVASFRADNFDPESDFLRIGDGSLGGKARGLAFMSNYLEKNREQFDELENITVSIPKSLVITTDSFDQFIFENQLEDYYKAKYRDEEIVEAFKVAKLPAALEDDLRSYLVKVHKPIAVRSSSLLEDSKDHPYAGLYSTYMLPNNHPDFIERLHQLSVAIKLVYASMFFEGPTAFSKTTKHRTEEEKMAVIIQELTGRQNGNYFYPAISGTAQSYNFYPIGYMKSGEGIANISLGLGKIVVEGGQTLRFSPKYPQMLPQFSSVDNILKNSQKFFFSLDLQNSASDLGLSDDVNLVRRDIYQSINEGSIKLFASTYEPHDHRIRDSIPVKGTPVLTFANVLKFDQISLPKVLDKVLKIAKKGFGCDVEIEFSVNFADDSKEKHEFVLLQARPMTTPYENIGKEITDKEIKKAVCFSTSALGKGNDNDIKDIIIVKPDKFTSHTSISIAKDISKINAALEKQDRKYLLVGPGRWGSADHCLGVPVAWKDISGVGGIVETSTKTFRADPSQGTHFFQNITSLGIIYFTVYQAEDYINWDWFWKRKVINETEYIVHIETKKPLNIKINLKKNHGVILAK